VKVILSVEYDYVDLKIKVIWLNMNSRNSIWSADLWWYYW